MILVRSLVNLRYLCRILELVALVRIMLNEFVVAI